MGRVAWLALDDGQGGALGQLDGERLEIVPVHPQLFETAQSTDGCGQTRQLVSFERELHQASERRQHLVDAAIDGTAS